MFSSNTAGLRLITVTFPAGTSSWTAPAGVANISTAVGKGANGTADFWDSSTGYNYLASVFVGYPFDPGHPTTSSTTTVGDVYNEVTSLYNSRVAAISATAPPGTYLSSNPFLEYFTNYPTTGQLEKNTNDYGAGYYYKSSPSVNYGGFTSGSATKLIDLTSSPASAYSTGIFVLIPGTTGASTTAFSRTFPGGNPSTPTAPTTTFTNVAVTPGVTYTIVNNQSLTITYLG
jgi:hypothetical protein